MMGPKIILVLFLIVILGAAVYLARSGVVNKLGTLKFWPSLPSSTTSSAAPWYLQNNSSAKPAAQNEVPWYLQNQSSAGGSSSGGASINPSDIPAGFTASDLSPYFHEVRLGSVYAGSGFSSRGQISLSANFNPSTLPGADGNVAIDITGWLLRANRGSWSAGRAINVYLPFGVSPESDIYLKNGDVLNVYVSRNYIGPNLRLNKCIGYIANAYNFDPELPLDCPYVQRTEISGFRGECQNYILSLGACKIPDPNPPVPQNDYECRAYLDNLNYKGCFDKYSGNADFLSNEVWAWTGGNFLDQSHDRLLLLDGNGKLVDLYEY